MPLATSCDFMGERRVDSRRAVALSVDYASRHPHLPYRRRSSPLATLIATCAATQFNPERCTVPLSVPFRETVPTHQPQYALGRVETLLRAGYYHAGSCIRALNLEYDGTGLTWDIRLNDFFVACTASRKHPFGTFPARLVLDAVALPGRSPRRQGSHVVRDNVVQRRTVSVPTPLVQVARDSVTARELCQLAGTFGMKMYEPVDQSGTTRVAFLSHVRSVPPHLAHRWRPFSLDRA